MNQPRRILIVDDESSNRKVLSAQVEAFGHEPELAKDGYEALAKLRLDIDLVLLDAVLPGMDGFEVARRIREDPETHDLPIIMQTALTSKEDRMRAVEAGVNDFISKPIDKTELRLRMTSLLKMKEAQDAIKQQSAALGEMVERRTAALREALNQMADAQRRTYEAQLDTIHRLALAAEQRDEHSNAHLQRVSHYCAMLSNLLKLPPSEVETIQHGSTMHDVGKIGIPDRILLKTDRLTEGEREVMRQHTVIGGHILSGSPSELLQAGEVIALSHHEKWDGSGYPSGLAGEDIPLWGRICTVADVYDALTTERPYKHALDHDHAVTIMKEGKGIHFDPRVLQLFTANLDEVLAIQEKYRDPVKHEEKEGFLDIGHW